MSAEFHPQQANAAAAAAEAAAAKVAAQRKLRAAALRLLFVKENEGHTRRF